MYVPDQPFAEPEHSGFRKAESNSVAPEPAEIQLAGPPKPAKLDVIEDEQWYEVIPSAYAEEPEQSIPKERPTNLNHVKENTVKREPHDPNTVYLDENGNAVSVGGVPLEAKHQTEPKEPTWEQRGNRATQMIGAAPSMGTNNSINEFIEGLAAPVHNIVLSAQQFGRDLQSKIDGKGFSGQSQYKYELWQKNQKAEQYKETLVDNLISGEQPTKSPAYYVGSALTDIGMFLAPVPAGKGAVGAKFAVAGARNSKKAERIAKATHEKGDTGCS